MTVFRVIWISIGYIVGICLATATGIHLPTLVHLAVAIPALTAAVIQFRDEKRWKPHSRPWIALAMVVLALSVGYWRGAQRFTPGSADSLRTILSGLPDGARLGLRGQIYAEPEIRVSGRGDMPLRVTEIRVGQDAEWRRVEPGNVLVVLWPSRRPSQAEADALNRLMDPRAYGWQVEADATYRAPQDAMNPGEFSERAFLMQEDILAQFRGKPTRVTVLAETRGNWITELAMEAKRSFLTTYKTTVREPASRLVAGATLGARRAVEKTDFMGRDISQTFRHSGVGHVLAVSGLHVSVVSILLYALFRGSGLRVRTFTPIIIVFLILFAVLTGARPSSVRSVIMNSVVLIAFAYFRCNLRRATFSGLSLSASMILVGNPAVLFSPGFLLSFGAVLSLVLISPPLYRFLRNLHGGALLGACAWMTLVFVLSCVAPRALVDPWNAVGLAALLWFFLSAARRLHGRWPGLRALSIGRMPVAVPMMLSAQFAIQIGMMIPLSAWFFGQFPVSGMLVNLIAIPAIGVVIQLGLLTGLVALIPFAGTFLAMPLGAAETVSCNFFYFIAWLGTLLPYPAIPKPTLGWMIGYYGAVGLVLAADHWRTPLQAFLYAAWRRLEPRPLLRGAVTALPVLLLTAPAVNLLPRPERCERLTCVAAGNYPILALQSTRGKTALINAGNKFAASGAVFNALRSQGGMVVDQAILPAFPAETGWNGIPSLMTKMRVRSCSVPLLASTPQGLLDKIGDDYLASAVADRAPWATNTLIGFAALLSAASASDLKLTEISDGPLLRWSDDSITALPRTPALPRRFVSTARSSILALTVRGFRWIVITDASSDSLDAALKAGERCDVLVLPTLPGRTTFERVIEEALRRTSPRCVILCGDDPPAFDTEAWAQSHKVQRLLATARSGAILAEFLRDGSLSLHGYADGSEFVLGRRD